MRTLIQVREYLQQHPGTPVVILDIDDMTMGTTSDGHEYIINEAELASSLQGKVVCFATDKAGNMPQVLIDFCERHDLMFAPEMYGRTAKLRGLLLAVRDTIVDQPLIQFIQRGDLTDTNAFRDAFRDAIAKAYSLYHDELIINVSEINLDDIDNLCQRFTLLLIQHEKPPAFITTLLGQYYDIINDLPNLDRLKNEGTLVQRIYKQLASATDLMVQAGSFRDAIKLFHISQDFITEHKKDYKGIESFLYIRDIYNLDTDASYQYLNSRSFGIAERSDIQNFLLNRLMLSSNIEDSLKALKSLLLWTVTSVSNVAGNTPNIYGDTINACVALDKKIRAFYRLLPDDHPIKQADIYGLWVEALQGIQLSTASTSTATEQSASLNASNATAYYQSLGADKLTHILFCQEIYPRLYPHDMYVLPLKENRDFHRQASSSSTSQASPLTPETISARVDAQMEQLNIKIDNFVFNNDGSIFCAIHLQGTDGSTLIYDTTFPNMTAYKSFFIQKHPVFLYIMRELNVLPSGWQERSNVHYLVKGDSTFQEVDMYFADDSQEFCNYARTLGITYVVHGDTPPAINECVKSLSRLSEEIQVNSQRVAVDMLGITDDLPEAEFHRRQPLDIALRDNDWNSVQQQINQIIRARVQFTDSAKQQTFNAQLNAAADSARAFVTIQGMLSDVYRNLPECFQGHREAIADKIKACDWQAAQALIINLRAQVDLYPGNSYIRQLGGKAVAPRIDAAAATRIIHSSAYRESPEAYLHAEITQNYPLSRALGLQLDRVQAHTDMGDTLRQRQHERYTATIANVESGYAKLTELMHALNNPAAKQFKDIQAIYKVWDKKPLDIYYLAQVITRVLQKFEKPGVLRRTKVQRIEIANEHLRPLSEHLNRLIDLPLRRTDKQQPSDSAASTTETFVDHKAVMLAYEHMLSAKGGLVSFIFSKQKIDFFIDEHASQQITINKRSALVPPRIAAMINHIDTILGLSTADHHHVDKIGGLTALTAMINTCLVNMKAELPDHEKLKSYLLNIKKRLFQLEQLENNLTIQLLHGLPQGAPISTSSTSTQAAVGVHTDRANLSIIRAIFSFNTALRDHLRTSQVTVPTLHTATLLQRAQILQQTEIQERLAIIIADLQKHGSIDATAERIITERLVNIVTGKQLYEFYQDPEAWKVICTNPLFEKMAASSVLVHLLASKAATPTLFASEGDLSMATTSSSPAPHPSSTMPTTSIENTHAGVQPPARRLVIGSSRAAAPRSLAHSFSDDRHSSLFSHPTSSSSSTPSSSTSSPSAPDNPASSDSPKSPKTKPSS